MSDTIKFTVEGPDSEHGHVRVERVVEQLERLLSALNGIDRLVGDADRPKLYYRISEATHSSPMSITLEPVTV